MFDGKPLRADARRNREALLAAARRTFDDGGFFDLRFDDFARLAGVGAGTLYRHFPTREALAEAVYHEEVATLCARAHHLRATLPAGEALATFLRDLASHMKTHEGLARTLATIMATRSDVLAEGGLAVEQAVGELVEAAAEEGSIRSDVHAGAVMMVLHGIGAAHSRPGWRTEVDDVITLVLDGLRRS
ncbi:TetR/AcrR family transcriptional regulator [Lentzea sp. NPDC060358]|uniref:TetR/AcrR family transcriptional regulator n=1 Tax=Lentzea sp. NPDC060358 TaxID=3347103 RepID=UPI003668C0CC